jgi:hypothetical protein
VLSSVLKDKFRFGRGKRFSNQFNENVNYRKHPIILGVTTPTGVDLATNL